MAGPRVPEAALLLGFILQLQSDSLESEYAALLTTTESQENTFIVSLVNLLRTEATRETQVLDSVANLGLRLKQEQPPSVLEHAYN